MRYSLFGLHTLQAPPKKEIINSILEPKVLRKSCIKLQKNDKFLSNVKLG